MRTVTIALLVCITAGLCAASDRGIAIRPDAEGQFVYEDDFSTPKCLTDAFLGNTGPEVWQEGALVISGPNRHRTLTWRFFGDRTITDLQVTVEQRANARQWGGRNLLYASTNGIDWVLVADSRQQEGDDTRWQTEPFVLEGEEARQFTGGDELWLRIELDNFSGLETIVSNRVENLRVQLTLGGPASEAEDTQRKLRERWGQVRERVGWRAISVDAADPPGDRPPHYYRDADGWLVKPGQLPHLETAERDSFRIQRVYRPDRRSPLGLACFVETEGPEELLARITITATREGSRQMRVLWDGEEVATADAASYFDEPRTVFAALSGGSGVHQLEVTAGDSGVVVVQEIALAGGESARWVARPPMPQGRRLEVLAAEYLPDPPPPADSQAVEGRHAQQEAGLIFAGLQRFYEEHEDFGALRVYLRNPGPEPVRIDSDLRLNGRDLADHNVDFETSEWDARGVIWHRVRPRLLQPGECAEVYIRFRRRPEGPAADLSVPCENAPTARVRIPYDAPPATIDYVVASEGGDRLYVYVRPRAAGQRGRLSAIALDGRPVEAELHGADFADGIALAVADLDRPLEPWSYHVVGAQTEAGEWVAAQFRVLPWIFPRSSIHVPSEICGEMNMNVGMWHHRSLEDCREHDIFTVTNTDRMFDAHERVLFVMGPDEPDARDNRGGGYNRGLGYNARRLMHSGWGTLVRTQAPGAGTWVIMNGTTRPLNWCVYGQLADVACFDPYPINFYGADHSFVRESLDYVRRCGAPAPLYACLEAFGWRSGQGVPGNARGPIPEEYRQNVVQALGVGTKGLTSWVYSAGAGGWQINDAVREEIARMNALIAAIEDELLLGCPVDWASTDAGLVETGVVGNEAWPKERVWAGALLCGSDAIVVAVANHIPASKPDPPRIEPARDLTVTISLPDYLRDVEAFEATPEGLQSIPCEVRGDAAALALDEVVSGRVFVLRRRR